MPKHVDRWRLELQAHAAHKWMRGGINDGKYAYNNLQHYDATWYHRFNAKWHTATEAWYMYERQVPDVAGKRR
jgi:hypothetical protein